MRLGDYVSLFSSAATGQPMVRPLGRSEGVGDTPARPLGASQVAWGASGAEMRAPLDLRSGIIATAQSLGMDPEVLATIISYETGGTFDPRQRGPTTQWGQHRGLIQFGEPQAAQHGVDWNDPLGSQLGPNGAVASYFRQNGYQPGMGLLDAYSIVNAGGPGRYNASDANNGGAPGSVADKVNDQMGGHRANAVDLLGGGFTPNPGIAGAFGGGTGGATPGAPYTPAGAVNNGYMGNALAAPPAAPAQAQQAAPRPFPGQLDASAFMTQPQPNALASWGFGPGQSPFLMG